MTNLQGENLKIIQPNSTYLEDRYKKFQAENPDRKVWMCPPENPYSVANQSSPVTYSCIHCTNQENTFFQAEEEKCVAGCPRKHIYDSKASVCKKGLYLTDPKSEKLLSPTASYNEWAVKTNSDMSSVEGARYCPNSKPYAILRGEMTECIVCDGGKYFNIENRKCEECSYHREYNEEVRRCTGVYYDSVSLDRMISNIW